MRPRPIQLRLVTPSLSVDLNEQEGRYFQEFAAKTIKSGFVAAFSSFWTSVVLRECHSSPSIAHAIVAIGALDTSLQQQGSASQTIRLENLKDVNHEFALFQYQKAIRGLRKSLSDNLSDLQPILVSCIVLACFDFFHGHRHFGLKHIRFGLKFLMDWRSSKNSSSAKESKTRPLAGFSDGEEIEHMICRLDTMAASFMGHDLRYLFDKSSFRRDAQEVIVPDTFANPEAIRDVADALIFRDVPEDATKLRDTYIAKIKPCQDAILSFEHQHSCRVPEGPKLFMYHLLVRLSTILVPEGTSSDSLMEIFEQVMTLSQEIINGEIMNMKKKVTFDCEMGVAPALYLVACHCREPALRRRAIDLLFSSHRKEGTWDSHFAGKLAQWRMAIEEESMDENGYIPEKARINSESLKFDMQTRTATVRCTQNMKDADGDYKVRTNVLKF